MRDTFFVLFVCFIAVSYGYKTRPTVCTGLHEELDCVKECPPERTCRNREIKFSCLYDKKPCTPKCVCKKGYFRNIVGTCITEAQCGRCCRPNEYFSCDSACDNECSNLDTQNRTNCPIKNIKCNEMCYCEDGYARDSNNNCIPVDKCPKKPNCGCNEEFTCRKSCPPDQCFSLVARFKCDSTEKCTKGCHCKPGFLRDEKKGKKSTCLPICECPQMINSPDCRKGPKY